MHLSGIFGLLMLAGVFGLDLVIGGTGFVLHVIHVPGLMVCVFGTIGLAYLSFGALETLRAIRALSVLLAEPREIQGLARCGEVLSGAIGCMYAAGAAGTLIGVFKIVYALAVGQTFHVSAGSVVVVLLPVFYALILAEFVLRPAVRRIRGLVAQSS
jgi:hypothetical protein